MVIYGVYIVSKSGGLIFNHDHNIPKIEVEKSFNFPLDIKLSYENKKVVVVFGQRDGINGKVYPLLFVVIIFAIIQSEEKCSSSFVVPIDRRIEMIKVLYKYICLQN